MTWNINLVGRPHDVAHAISEQVAALKDGPDREEFIEIAGHIKALVLLNVTAGDKQAVKVEGAGYTGRCQLTIEPIYGLVGCE